MKDTMSSLKDSATNCSVSFTNDSRNINLEEEERTPSPPLRRRADGSFIQVLRRLGSLESTSDHMSPRQNILRPHPTFDSNTSSEESNSPSRKVHRKQQATRTPSPPQRDIASPSPPSSCNSSNNNNNNNNNTDLSRFSQHGKADDHDDDYESTILSVLYIALFSVFGAVLRIYIARFFGLDCEFSSAAAAAAAAGDDDEDYVDDFLTPFASHICVTASGRTEQTGGALFTDLPANMLGRCVHFCFGRNGIIVILSLVATQSSTSCVSHSFFFNFLFPFSFLVGLLTPTAQAHRLPWFRPDHPLQHHIPFITALRVGFCGSLTTCK